VLIQMYPSHTPILCLRSISNFILPRPSLWSLQVFRLKFCMHFSSPPTCYMSHPSHPPRFDHPGSIWRRVHVLKLLMQFSPTSCYFLPHRSKYSAQHPLLIQPNDEVFFYFDRKKLPVVPLVSGREERLNTRSPSPSPSPSH